MKNILLVFATLFICSLARGQNISNLELVKSIDVNNYGVSDLDVYFNNNYQLIAYSNNSGAGTADTLVIYDFKNNVVLSKILGVTWDFDIQFVNENQLLYRNNNAVYRVVNFANPVITELLPAHTIGRFILSPDKTKLIAVRTIPDVDDELQVFNYDPAGNLTPVKTFDASEFGQPNGGDHLSISVDNNFIAVSGGYEQDYVHLINLSTDEVTKIITSPHKGTYSPTFFSNNGELKLVVGGGWEGGSLEIIDVGTKLLTNSIPKLWFYNYSISVDQTEKYLVCGGYAGEMKLINIGNMNFTDLKSVAINHINKVKFTQDNQYVVSGSGAGSNAKLVIQRATQAEDLEPTLDEFLPMYSGNIKWADLDNDKDLDIINEGFIENANEFYTKVYENINGTFTEHVTQLPNIRNGRIDLGDVDKDGDLDVLLTGLSANGNITELYTNAGGFAFSLQSTFQGLINSTASFFDLDNDNDLDILLVGVDDSNQNPEPGEDPDVEVALVYKNTNNVYSPVTGTNLPPCTGCSIDWADGDGDGDVDLLMTGWGEDFYSHTWLYFNNGDNSFSQDTKSTLKNFNNSDVKWGDFDNDGDMDFLLTGSTQEGVFGTIVYENNSGVFSERTDIHLEPLGGTSTGGTKWMDYNNDGYLDILLTGSNAVGDRFFKLYMNNGAGNFDEVNLDLQGISDSSVDIGDYDNDGDQDICYMGSTEFGPVTGIYKNLINSNPSTVFTEPLAPAVNSFMEHFYRNEVTLMWGDGSDIETPTPGLSYNFRLRNSTSSINSPAVNYTTGYLLADLPQNGHGKKAIVRNIPESENFWSVQSIDGNKSGSLFSEEKAFYQINGPEALNTEIIDVSNIKLNWVDNSSVETSYHVTRSTTIVNGYSPIATLPANTNSYVDNFTFLTDTYYYYHIYAANATKASAYDSLQALIPTAPTNFLAHSINASNINLVWEDLSHYESGYEVQRKLTSGNNFITIATLGPNIESYMDAGLSEGTSYDYRVRALIYNGGSAFIYSSAQTNFRPLGTNFALATLEDVSLNFSAVNFTDAFSDPDVNDELVEIKIATLPIKGTLKLNATPVSVGQIIPKADLNSLHFIPSLNLNGVSSFSYYNNDGKDNSAITYIVTLNITPVNDPPAFTLPTTVEANEDFSTPVKIMPSLATVPQDELSQVVTYSLQPVTSDKVTVQLNPATGEITLTAILNKFGEVQFILLANDGQSVNNTFSDTVKFVIKAVNDAPVLSSIPNQEAEVKSIISPIAFTVTDVDSPIASVVVSAVSDNPLVIKNENITIQGAAQDKSIVLLPETKPGEAKITLTANDGAASTSTEFKLKIFTVTGVPELENLEVKIFPNPFTSFINVTWEEPVGSRHVIILFDHLGREISRHEITERESTLTFKEINKGIYILGIFGDGGDLLYRSRIIKN